MRACRHRIVVLGLVVCRFSVVKNQVSPHNDSHPYLSRCVPGAAITRAILLVVSLPSMRRSRAIPGQFHSTPIFDSALTRTSWKGAIRWMNEAIMEQ